MKKLLVGCALSALAASSAYAQSTGSVDFENKEIVITGTRANGVGGVVAPNTSKTREVLTSTLIQHQTPGQTVDEIINMMPGVSFQNNDPYGSSGGTLNIRGFDASRISQTVDGIPLNDTGNYAIYSNQQVDPELIDQIDVSLGSTDVDSPTASATGSTVNLRTRNPTDDFHVRIQGSAGEYSYFRVFGVVDTGTFTPWGTKAWLSASSSSNDNPYNRSSKVDKAQYNFKVYQPIGASGDFVAVAGNWNVNRNNNFTSGYLRTDPTILTVSGKSPTQTLVSTPRVVGTASSNRFPTNKAERDYDQGHCLTDAPQTGVADVPNACGTQYDYSYNPSNTGNIRANSRFTLADGLVLTVDPSYQSTKANGGASAVAGFEYGYTRSAGSAGPAITTPLIGYVGGKPYFGTDLNGDGDKLDQVEVYAPSHTETHRWIVISSLRYDVSDTQTVRLNYTFDHGRHRQTGEVGTLLGNGYATYYFPINSPLLDVNGNVMEKRNRLSYAILNQVSGEYRGEFLDNKLTVNLGIRAPFFKRELNNYCVSESGGSGFVDCFASTANQATFLSANPSYNPPQQRQVKYSKVLPSAGIVYEITGAASFYANYSKGLQVPGTDSLYNSFAFAADSDAAHPKAETTDNFDTGLRYRTSKIQAQIAAWYTNYKNRLASSYDPEQNVTVYRNLGTVHKYGIDASLAYQPTRQVLAYVFGSYLKSKIVNDVLNGENAAGVPIYALTAGKRESGAPVYTLGARVEGNLGPVELGAQVKRTGERYVDDENLPVTQSYTLNGVTTNYQVYGARAPGYTVVDLDARIKLDWVGLNDRTYFQFNVTNLFDKLYVAGFGGTLSHTKVVNAYISPPRAVSGTLVVGF